MDKVEGRPPGWDDLWLPADCHLCLIICTHLVCVSAPEGIRVSFIRPPGLFSQTSQQHAALRPPASSQRVKTGLLLTCRKVVASFDPQSCPRTPRTLVKTLRLICPSQFFFFDFNDFAWFFRPAHFFRVVCFHFMNCASWFPWPVAFYFRFLL